MAEVATKHPLQTGWSLWFDSHSSIKSSSNWGNHLKCVYTFAFVEDFWSLYHNIKPASELATGTDYNIFRDGIEPAWEDPKNSKGGKWMVSLSPKQRPNLLDQRWLHTLLACVGETLEDHNNEEGIVCGTVLSVRKRADRLAVWTRYAPEEQIMDVGRKFQAALAEFVKGDQITFHYYLHESAAQASKSKNVPAKYTIAPLP